MARCKQNNNCLIRTEKSHKHIKQNNSLGLILNKDIDADADTHGGIA